MNSNIHNEFPAPLQNHSDGEGGQKISFAILPKILPDGFPTTALPPQIVGMLQFATCKYYEKFRLDSE